MLTILYALRSCVDETWMQEALEEAKKGALQGEVPVGAVLVHDNKIIARAHNRVEELKDATAHAEMLCLKEGAAALGNWRLIDATLYCTLEPCSMCAGAMFLARVKTLVWGAPDLRHGAHGSWVDLFSQPHAIHQLAVRQGVLREESAALLKGFFQQRRCCGNAI